MAEEAKNKIFIDTTLPNIANRWMELKIPIPKDKEKLNFITQRMNSVISHQWESLKKIDNFKSNFDVYSV